MKLTMKHERMAGTGNIFKQLSGIFTVVER